MIFPMLREGKRVSSARVDLHLRSVPLFFPGQDLELVTIGLISFLFLPKCVVSRSDIWFRCKRGSLLL